MFFFEAATITADFIRIPYQGIEAYYQSYRNQTVGEKIMQVVKNAIALLDAIFTINHYTKYSPHLDRLRDSIVLLRFLACMQAAIVLNNDPLADREIASQDKDINGLMMFYHSIRIAHGFSPLPQRSDIFMRFVGFQLSCLFADVILRILSIYKNRLEISREFVAISDRIWDSISSVRDFIRRNI